MDVHNPQDRSKTFSSANSSPTQTSSKASHLPRMDVSTFDPLTIALLHFVRHYNIQGLLKLPEGQALIESDSELARARLRQERSWYNAFETRFSRVAEELGAYLAEAVVDVVKGWGANELRSTLAVSAHAHAENLRERFFFSQPLSPEFEVQARRLHDSAMGLDVPNFDQSWNEYRVCYGHIDHPMVAGSRCENSALAELVRRTRILVNEVQDCAETRAAKKLVVEREEGIRTAFDTLLSRARIKIALDAPLYADQRGARAFTSITAGILACTTISSLVSSATDSGAKLFQPETQRLIDHVQGFLSSASLGTLRLVEEASLFSTLLSKHYYPRGLMEFVASSVGLNLDHKLTQKGIEESLLQFFFRSGEYTGRLGFSEREKLRLETVCNLGFGCWILNQVYREETNSQIYPLLHAVELTLVHSAAELLETRPNRSPSALRNYLEGYLHRHWRELSLHVGGVISPHLTAGDVVNYLFRQKSKADRLMTESSPRSIVRLIHEPHSLEIYKTFLNSWGGIR